MEAIAVPLQTLRWQGRTQVFVERLDEHLDGVELPLVRIPAGEFVMGSPPHEPERSEDEGPQHRVQLSEFLMGRTPITQAQWRVVMEGNPSYFADKPDSDQRPIETVSWHDAMAFCRCLRERTGLYYSLPSEAQWEYACRAGTTTSFCFGPTLTPELANYNSDVSYANGPVGKPRKETLPVGLYPANSWGLRDMHGTVREWCLDHWHSNYEGAPTDGSAWLSDNSGEQASRLLRGGSCSYAPGHCRSACRGRRRPGHANHGLGFRVVCLPQDPSPVT